MTKKTIKKRKNQIGNKWSKKAWEVTSIIVRLRDKKCLICNKRGRPNSKGLLISGLDAHHIIAAKRSARRHDILNCITLCKGCHKGLNSSGKSPHGSGETVEAFWNWMKNDPKMAIFYQYYSTYAQDELPIKTYYDKYIHLKGLLDQYLKDIELINT